MRLASLGIVAALGLTVAAASAAPLAAPSTVTCESIIDPGGSYTWRPKRVVLGVVATPASYLPQTLPTGEARWRFWSKSGLVVRADSPPVHVSVPVRWRNRVAIAWGNSDAAAA